MVLVELYLSLKVLEFHLDYFVLLALFAFCSIQFPFAHTLLVLISSLQFLP